MLTFLRATAGISRACSCTVRWSRPSKARASKDTPMPDLRKVTVTANGKSYDREVESRLTLVDFIRHELLLTGTHVGCEHGVCGACTVLLDGAAVRACLLLAVQANGKSIATVEGLAEGDRLNPLQEAFRDNHGLQCGFCTPGMLM